MSGLSIYHWHAAAACKLPGKHAQWSHTYVAPTLACGLGLYTSRSFAQRSVVLSVEDPLYTALARPYDELIARGYTDADIFQVNKNRFIPPYGGLDDFTNHSCDPNCGLRVCSSGFVMFALRDIAADEELTYDYSTHLENPWEQMSCRCGTRHCRRVIGSFSTLSRKLQKRYIELQIVADFAIPAEYRAAQVA